MYKTISMRKLLIIVMLLAITTSSAQDNITVTLLPQVHVFFDLGSSVLTAAAKHTIDSMIYADVLPPGKRVGIVGHADILGEEKSNRELSQKRADAVAQYLKSMGIDSTQIESIIGEGERNRPEKAGGYPQDRQVSILPGGLKVPEKDKIVWTDSGTLIATIRFQMRTTDFLPQAIPFLDTVINILKKNPSMRVNAEGYVCCDEFGYIDPNGGFRCGIPQSEYRVLAGDTLSLRRAKAVYLYLLKRGIAADRMRCKGYGYRKPKYDEKGHFIHGIDRVEIRAVKEK
jgi:outer membrane protein OmpA-like peptidoglycan-associated protein